MTHKIVSILSMTSFLVESANGYTYCRAGDGHWSVLINESWDVCGQHDAEVMENLFVEWCLKHGVPSNG